MKAHPDIVAIGASSGGIEALQSLLKELADVSAIVLVVLHRPANRVSYLRDILLRNVHVPWWYQGTESYVKLGRRFAGRMGIRRRWNTSLQSCGNFH
jgi:hypothetical protein